MPRRRENPLIDRDCRDCGTTFKGYKLGSPALYCLDCRTARKRRSRSQKKQPPTRSFPPLADNWPTLSRGWFKQNLAKGHTADSLSFLSGIAPETIERELAFVRPAGVA